MAGLEQFQSFIGKFVSLWNQGLDAKLNVESSGGEAWIQLQVGLGEAKVPEQDQDQEGNVHLAGPARQRRRQRRAEGRTQKAEKVKDDIPLEDAAYAHVKEVKNEVKDVTEKVTKIKSSVICDSETTENVVEKKMCSVDFYPTDSVNIEDFKDEIEKYFKKRNDVIENVIDCMIENSGKRVKLRAVVKIRFAWTGFFNDPGENYGDLLGVRTVRHGCKNLSQCDPAPS